MDERTLRVLDLFSGLGGWSSGARPDDDVRTLDLDPRFGCTYTADILEVTPALFGDWRPDIVLASPPCERFTVMQMGRYWHGRSPIDERGKHAVALVQATLRLITALEPSYWIVENPRGVLRTLALMSGLGRRTVTYCQYGARTMKPTDLWGGFPPSLRLAPMCRNGDSCHVASPRGSKTGIQDASTSAAERALVPQRLSEAVLEAARWDLGRSPAAALPEPAYLWQLGMDLTPRPRDNYIDARPDLRGPDGRFRRA